MPESPLKRLHISPLNPELLQAVLNPSVRQLAADISFHSVQTFPEKSFGFVSLPAPESEKLVSKLNGSILKGKRFTVQEARPVVIAACNIDDSLVDGHDRVERDAGQGFLAGSSRSSPVAGKGNTVRGCELPSPRKVRRGWTEHRASSSKASSRKSEGVSRFRQQASKYSALSECLFRLNAPSSQPLPTKNTPDTPSTPKAKRPRIATTVHEFKHSTKYPMFLKSNSKATSKVVTTEYVDGKGWVDSDGNLKEPAVTSTRPINVGIERKRKRASILQVLDKNKSADEESSSTSDTSSESSEDDSDDVTSEDEEDEDEHESSVPSDSSEEQEQPPTVTNEPKSKAHPLESLFKNSPKEPSDPTKPDAATGFSFFGDSNEDTHDSADDQIYMDIPKEHTEDWTNHETKSDSLGVGKRPKPQGGKPQVTTDKETPAEPNEFSEWFWKNRGDNNRAWKRRRREAAKEKRQKDNRRRR